jgi:hemoglobin
LEEAHREVRISPEEFDEVAAELARSLDHFKVPEREKGEVLAAFAAHKGEVNEGFKTAMTSR